MWFLGVSLCGDGNVPDLGFSRTFSRQAMGSFASNAQSRSREGGKQNVGWGGGTDQKMKLLRANFSKRG